MPADAALVGPPAGAAGVVAAAAAGFVGLAVDIILPTEALMEEAAPDDDNVVEREGGKLSIELSLGNTVAIRRWGYL